MAEMTEGDPEEVEDAEVPDGDLASEVTLEEVLQAEVDKFGR